MYTKIFWNDAQKFLSRKVGQTSVHQQMLSGSVILIYYDNNTLKTNVIFLVQLIIPFGKFHIGLLLWSVQPLFVIPAVRCIEFVMIHIFLSPWLSVSSFLCAYLHVNLKKKGGTVMPRFDITSGPIHFQVMRKSWNLWICRFITSYS